VIGSKEFVNEAFAGARQQAAKLDARVREASAPRPDDAGTALRGLTLTKPVPVDERIAEARADFARLVAFTEMKKTK
jgi:hypothetical protein